MSYQRYASVVLDLAIDKPLDYGIPDQYLSIVKKGMQVKVPVRGLLRNGYVIEVKQTTTLQSVRPIAETASQVELINDEILKLALWMAKYYCAPLHQVFKSIIPGPVRSETKPKEQLYVMRQKTREEIRGFIIEVRNQAPAQAAVMEEMLKVTKGALLTELLERTGAARSVVKRLVELNVLKIDIVRVDRSPLVNEEYFKTKPKVLTEEQAEAKEKIAAAINENRFEPFLLHGITGSGKTEIYLQTIEHALSQGKGAIMLVPEISLTAQMIERFLSRFNNRIAVLHHRLSQGERYDEWHRIYRGEAKIVIGPRSALFCPVENLGIIIIDEEHEGSYKQGEESPCYHGRDVAVIRGQMNPCPVVLGSATPSLQSYYNAQRGKFKLLELSARAEKSALPDVLVVDMKREFEKAKGFTLFSDPLLSGIKNRMEKGEQAILFLNRRGFHSAMGCQSCSEVIKCEHCDLSLTFHKSGHRLSCHICGYTIAPPSSCPSCKGETMKFKGAGTEQVEKALHAIFPEIRTLRIDADTTRHKGSHQKLIRDFGSGKADVLIGTQMIAKGLHFPQVTLVGVLNTDQALNIPDFTSSEKVFQLITQVSGRAGRGFAKGEVLIQTLIPENDTIQVASRQDYRTFYQNEIAVRKLFDYPPFTHFIKVVFSGPDEKKVEALAKNYRSSLIPLLPPSAKVHPVAPCGHAKVKDRYRLQFLLLGSSVYRMNQAILEAEKKFYLPKKYKRLIDVDPVTTFF